YHRDHPYVLTVGGRTFTVDYEPGESTTGVFGGNSNWRGPVWFPMNFIIIQALRRFHNYYGDDFKVECPTGSGVYLTLKQVADELPRRLLRLFLPDGEGRRPALGPHPRYATDPHFKDYPLFYEYFHGDQGWGLGASHQTGWTALVADLLRRVGGGAGFQTTQSVAPVTPSVAAAPSSPCRPPPPRRAPGRGPRRALPT